MSLNAEDYILMGLVEREGRRERRVKDLPCDADEVVDDYRYYQSPYTTLWTPLLSWNYQSSEKWKLER